MAPSVASSAPVFIVTPRNPPRINTKTMTSSFSLMPLIGASAASHKPWRESVVVSVPSSAFLVVTLSVCLYVPAMRTVFSASFGSGFVLYTPDGIIHVRTAIKAITTNSTVKAEGERSFFLIFFIFSTMSGASFTPVLDIYSVKAITALMVCIRFSAWSKTIEFGERKTSSVTSIASSPKSSLMCWPVVVNAS